jgi:endonuclease-3
VSELKDHARRVYRRLARAIPEPRVELDHENAWQLLIATILAAQSTDATINRVTPALFAKYPTPAALASAPREDLETLVKATGFFRNKAKAIQAASAKLVADHGGVVPKRIDDLVQLPGVARKTANVVLGIAYGIASGIVVDTHVGRVSRRLELTYADDPVVVEKELVAVFPRRSWVHLSHRLILHGRYVCTAKAPACASCCLNELCASAEAPPGQRWTERADAEADAMNDRLAARL